MPIAPDQLAAQIETELAAQFGDPTRVIIDDLGTPNQSGAYDLVMTQLSRAILSDPSGIYYLIFLAKNNFRAQVNILLGELDAIDDAAADLNVPQSNIDDLTQLSGAFTALSNLEQRLLQNQTLDSTAARIYLNRIERFFSDQLVPNIQTESGEIANSPANARVFLRIALASVVGRWGDLLAGVDTMLTELDAFLQMNLAAIAAAETVSAARRSINSVIQEWDGLTPSQRTERASEVFVRLMVGRDQVSNSSSPVDSEVHILNGDNGYATEPFVPAQVISQNVEPFQVVGAQQIQFRLGPTAPAVTVDLPPSIPAQIDSGLYTPGITLTAGTAAAITISEPGSWLVRAPTVADPGSDLFELLVVTGDDHQFFTARLTDGINDRSYTPVEMQDAVSAIPNVTVTNPVTTDLTFTHNVASSEGQLFFGNHEVMVTMGLAVSESQAGEAAEGAGGDNILELSVNGTPGLFTLAAGAHADIAASLTGLGIVGVVFTSEPDPEASGDEFVRIVTTEVGSGATLALGFNPFAELIGFGSDESATGGDPTAAEIVAAIVIATGLVQPIAAIEETAGGRAIKIRGPDLRGETVFVTPPAAATEALVVAEAAVVTAEAEVAAAVTDDELELAEINLARAEAEVVLATATLATATELAVAATAGFVNDGSYLEILLDSGVTDFPVGVYRAGANAFEGRRRRTGVGAYIHFDAEDQVWLLSSAPGLGPVTELGRLRVQAHGRPIPDPGLDPVVDPEPQILREPVRGPYKIRAFHPGSNSSWVIEDQDIPPGFHDPNGFDADEELAVSWFYDIPSDLSLANTGDVLYVPSKAAPTITAVIDSVESDGSKIFLLDGIDTSVENSDFEIWSSARLAFEIFESELTTWRNVLLANAGVADDLANLQVRVNPLLVNLRASSSGIRSVRQETAKIRALLTSNVFTALDATIEPEDVDQTLVAVFDRYEVLPSAEICQLLNTLDERGLDRALGLLFAGKIIDFFSLSYSQASSAGFALELMRNIAAKDINLSRTSPIWQRAQLLMGADLDFDPELDPNDVDQVAGTAGHGDGATSIDRLIGY